MKRLLSLILAIAIFMSMGVLAYAEETINWSKEWLDSIDYNVFYEYDAENIEWEFDNNTNTLYVSGTGKIPNNFFGVDFWEEDWWYDPIPPVEHIVIGEGITEIGVRAFSTYFFETLLSVKLPQSLKVICGGAFRGNDKLSTVNIPSGLISFGTDAFSSTSINELVLPEGLKYFGGFFGLDIEELVIPESVENVPSIVVCNELKKIVVKSRVVSEFVYPGSVVDLTGHEYDATVLARDCENLEEVYIFSPNYYFNKSTIRNYEKGQNEDHYLANCPNATIYCYPGASKLINICKEEGISYCLIGEKPEKVSVIKVSANSESTVTLGWKASQNATDYIVQRYAPSKRRWITQGTTSDTTFTVDKCLLPGYVYKFRVRPVQNTDMGRVYGSYSDVFYGATKPEKVEGVKLSVKNRKLTVKWDSVERAKSYQVSYCTTKNGKYQPLKFSEKTSCSKYLKKGTYYVAVRARVKTPAGKYYYGRYSKIYKVNVK